MKSAKKEVEIVEKARGRRQATGGEGVEVLLSRFPANHLTMVSGDAFGVRHEIGFM